MQVKYLEDTTAAESMLALPKEFQGWQDVIHGGILATLLDEIMMHAVWHFAGRGRNPGSGSAVPPPLGACGNGPGAGQYNGNQGPTVEGQGRHNQAGRQPAHSQ